MTSLASKRRRKARWMRQLRATRMAAGQCYQCRASPLHSADLCATCYTKRQNRQRARRAKDRDERRCYVCQRPLETDGSMCRRCRADRRAKNVVVLTAGLCIACHARPRGNFRKCEPCRTAARERLSRAYREGRSTWHRRKKGLPIGQPGLRAMTRARTPKFVPPPEREKSRRIYVPPAGSIALALLGATVTHR